MNRLAQYPSTSAFAALDQWLDRAFTPRSSSSPEALTASTDPVVLRLDLPGVRKEELKLDVRDRVLKLTVTPTSERPFVNAGNRGWRLGKELDAQALTARFENGVLELTLPKIQPTETETRNIDIA